MPHKRVPPSVAMKQEVDELLNRGRQGLPLGEFIRAAARCCLQEAVEHEVTEFLGRQHYQRGERRRDVKGIATATSPRLCPAPKGLCRSRCLSCARPVTPSFRSQLARGLAATPGALERLVVGMYVRGLSTRDIEDLFYEVTGGQLVSKSAVSELSRTWEEDFQRWRTRDLSELEPLYLFSSSMPFTCRCVQAPMSKRRGRAMCLRTLSCVPARRSWCIWPWAATRATTPG